MFGRAIGRHVGNSNMAGHARNIDDGSLPLFFHDRDGHLHAFDGSKQISVEHLPALSHIHLCNGIEQAISGVVHPNVHVPKIFQGGLHQLLDLASLPDVAGHCHGALEKTNSVACSVNPCLLAGREHNVGPFFGKLLGNGLADSRGSARHHHNFSDKSHLPMFCIRSAPSASSVQCGGGEPAANFSSASGPVSHHPTAAAHLRAALQRDDR